MKPFYCDRCGEQETEKFAEILDTKPGGEIKKICRKCQDSFIQWWHIGRKK